MTQEWFWLEEGQAHGPADLDELAGRCAAQQLPAATSVWRLGEVEWLPLRDVLIGFGKLPRELSHPPDVLDPFEDPEWTETSPHPWRRYFARMLDTSLYACIVFYVIAQIGALWSTEATARFLELALSNQVLSTFLAVLVALPLNALVIGLLGTSLGKWLQGIRVLGVDRRPLGFRAALWREFHVWAAGMGLGITIVFLISAIVSFKRLSQTNQTAWDDPGDTLILQRRDGVKQLFLTILGAIAVVLLTLVGLTE